MAAGLGAAWLVLASGLQASAQARSDFDHLRSGFPLTGAHERVPCESCHLRGVFEGTPTNCATCHTNGAPWQAGGKSLQHVRSSDQCGDCHVTNSWRPALFDHMGVTSPCISCHNGATAEGKSPNHVPSGDDCETCHRTLAWVPAQFDHSMITGNCFSCHNGTTATGKSQNHVPSSNTCESCHNTLNWDLAGPFDHTGITGNCFSCHNGSTATGKSPSHFVTNLDCAECHTTAGWLPARYRHTGPNYPGDHAGNPDCRACHTSNAQVVPWSFAAYAPDCAGCHANRFNARDHDNQTVSELRDCAGACHDGSGRHRVNRGGW